MTAPQLTEIAFSMKKIRINELARELEVKAHEILDRLPELGVQEKNVYQMIILTTASQNQRSLTKRPNWSMPRSIDLSRLLFFVLVFSAMAVYPFF